MDELWNQLFAKMSNVIDAHELDLSGDVREQLSSIDDPDAKHMLRLGDSEFNLVVDKVRHDRRNEEHAQKL